MTDETKTTEVTAAAADPPAETQQLTDAEQKQLWREGLVQEAFDNRPELRAALGQKLDFTASRAKGHDQGFEDAARTLTMPQLQAIQALHDRRVTRYVREEFPRDLQATLAELALGMDEGGFLAGYVEGAAEFLAAYRRRLHDAT